MPLNFKIAFVTDKPQLNTIVLYDMDRHPALSLLKGDKHLFVNSFDISEVSMDLEIAKDSMGCDLIIVCIGSLGVDHFFKWVNVLLNSQDSNPPLFLCFYETEMQMVIKTVNKFINHLKYVYHFDEIGSPDLEFYEVLTSCMQGHKNAIKDYIHILDGKRSYLIKNEDIIKLRVGDRIEGKTVVITANKKINCSNSLNVLKSFLPKNMVQINRNTIINFDWISVLDHTEKELTLKNGTHHIIGKAYYANLRSKFFG